MEKPYEPAIVDALLACSLQKATGIDLREPAEPPYVAESLAVQILLRRIRRRALGEDGSVPLIAGFRVAMLLCCRVLADPLRTHPAGVRRDIDRVVRWLESSSGLTHCAILEPDD